MSLLLHGDCLEHMKHLDDDSVDLVFCDLPYGQTSCKWDCKIDMVSFWKEIMRIKKLNTPLFFTTTTKFGIDLLNSAPKKCPFRYDLVWVKSAPAGFLCAKKMPMRKHEMVYVFYEKLPLYDLSSHRHKFIRDGGGVKEDRGGRNESMYKTKRGDKNADVGVEYTEAYREKHGNKKWEPPLPVSIVKEPEPVSVLKEDPNHKPDLYGVKSGNPNRNKGFHNKVYDPPLPVSIVKEPEPEEKKLFKTECNTAYGKATHHSYRAPVYDPPLPVSVVKEDEEGCYGAAGVSGEGTYKGEYYLENNMTANQGGQKYDPPLPVSIVKEEQVRKDPHKTAYGENIHHHCNQQKNGESIYDPPLPTTMLEVKSTRGKHSTEKPVALMEWIMKYYSKEGDVVLDPTMGSGSTGVACKNMNRNFIGIEMDPEIYEVAVNRIEG